MAKTGSTRAALSRTHSLRMKDASEPFTVFKTWLARADPIEPDNPTALALAPAKATGSPAVRIVLIKPTDPRGFVF